jgi:dTDP-4-amino-4,6-dideoxygalactose transaminase
MSDVRQTRSSFLPFSLPFVGEDEIAEINDSIRSGWLTTGPRVARFEEQFAAFCGAEAALAVNSCTDAMLVALAALGVGPGDEVITTAVTFVSTAHCIERLGAKPVLVDVEADTVNIDPAKIERAITPKTKAIVPVHLYGHPVELDTIRAIAAAHGLPVLEDSAHGASAEYKGRRIGSAGSLAAFSFYPTKNMTTGEGGMLVGEKSFIDRARPWSLHGMSKDAYARYTAAGSWFYDVVVPGFKSNMTDLQASLGLHQLRKLPVFQERRRAMAQKYDRAFASIPEVERPTERPDVKASLHVYVMRLNLDRLTIDRNTFIAELKARNIGTSVHFIPVHLHTYYREKYGYQPGDFPVAVEQFSRMMSLPLHLKMNDDDVDDVIDAVSSLVDSHRR